MKQEGIEEKIFNPQPVEAATVPMIIKLGRSQLMALAREQGIYLPEDTVISFRVPGGGDYSNEDVELDNKERVISIRYGKAV